MTSIPIRIVHWSAIHPTSGRISRPGMTHSDATEKPVARARGGIASDKTARMPGATTASSAEIAQLRTTATTRFGDRANTRSTRAAAERGPREEADQARMSAVNRRVAILAPRTRPTSWNGSAIAAAKPRAALVEPELLLVQQRREGHEADEADGEERERRPDAPQARDPLHGAPALGERRRRLLGHHTSYVAPVASRSQRPRTGSFSRSARKANTSVGTTKTKNGTRQPNW